MTVEWQRADDEAGDPFGPEPYSIHWPVTALFRGFFPLPQ
jgi:hypothetical protein